MIGMAIASWITLVAAIAAVASALFAYLQYRHAKAKAKSASNSAKGAAESLKVIAGALTECRLGPVRDTQKFQPKWGTVVNTPQYINAGWLPNTGKKTVTLGEGIEIRCYDEHDNEVNKPIIVVSCYGPRKIGSQAILGHTLVPQREVTLMPGFEAYVRPEVRFETCTPCKRIEVRVPCSSSGPDQTWIHTINVECVTP